MTQNQRKKLLTEFPEAVSKIHCLHERGDIDDPTGKGSPGFLEVASLLQRLVGDRLSSLGVLEAS
jgi:protein-tyrosine-phosphatase